MAKKKQQSLGVKILVGIWKIIKFILTPVFYVLSAFCLWLPVLYCAFGYALMYFMGFNPFALDANSLYYLIGLAICILVSAIMIARKRHNKREVRKKEREEEREKEQELAEKRAQKRANRNKVFPKKSSKQTAYFEEEDEHDSRARAHKKNKYSKKSENSRDTISSSARKMAENPHSYSQFNKEQFVRPEVRYAEVPKVYFSSREENTLIHEYNDRFEVFRIINGERNLAEVLYKDVR
ncbi:MAG: hypothetical protein R3Y23_04055 [Bacillota bacterium]